MNAAPVRTERRAATRQLPRAERRSSVLAGAARAFAAGGFDATSMEAIAAEAGVTKLIVYRHFESKEALYRAVLDQVARRLAQAVGRAMSPDQARPAIVPAFLSVARQDPDGFRLLWRHAAREPRFAAATDEVRAASAAFAHEMLAGRVAAELLDWAAPLVVSFLVEAVLAWLDHGRESDDARFTSLTVRSLVALIGAWATREPEHGPGGGDRRRGGRPGGRSEHPPAPRPPSISAPPPAGG